MLLGAQRGWAVCRSRLRQWDVCCCDAERRHLTRELDDEIGQTLTAAKLNLKIIAPDVSRATAGWLDNSVQLLDRLL